MVTKECTEWFLCKEGYFIQFDKKSAGGRNFSLIIQICTILETLKHVDLWKWLELLKDARNMQEKRGGPFYLTNPVHGIIE